MSRIEGKNQGKVEPPKRRALGKGLESLLSTPAAADVARSRVHATVTAHSVDDPFEAHPSGTPREVPTGDIDPNPYQTRMQVDEQKLDELARSIVANGVVQPIIVRPLPNGRFQLIAGERRWRASIKAGKETVPAILRQVSDEQAMEMTIVENLQRADLNPMEQARAYDRLSRDFHMTQEQVAQRTGKDRATVANFLRLLRLPARRPGQGRIRRAQLRPCTSTALAGWRRGNSKGDDEGGRAFDVSSTDGNLRSGPDGPRTKAQERAKKKQKNRSTRMSARRRNACSVSSA